MEASGHHTVHKAQKHMYKGSEKRMLASVFIQNNGILKTMGQHFLSISTKTKIHPEVYIQWDIVKNIKG